MTYFSYIAYHSSCALLDCFHYLPESIWQAQANELKVKQAQLAKAKAEVDINPNLIEVAPGGRVPKQKQKQAIPDIDPWFVVVS